MLTDRQQEILSYIESLSPAPTAREIAAHFKLGIGTIADHIRALRKKGYLAPAGTRQARCLRPVNSFRQLQQSMVNIPLYGSIPAGFADERHQEAEGCVTIDSKTLGATSAHRAFALQVKGDSMVGQHILAGDIAIVDRDREPRTGNVVAALIDGDSTLKIYQHNRGRPFLRAANPKYSDLIPSSELIVQGVLIAVVRRIRS